ncbi:MAG: TraR/DksA C4-type zinc finger protein [Sulfurovaceae bacterium]|nr:TraR/DksA C4-type zinc finger protein [Sulfurovaceae bacterium]
MTKAIQNKYYELQNNKEKLTREELLFFKKELEEKKEKIQKNLELTSKELNYNNKDCLRDESDYASVSVSNSISNAIIKKQNKTLNQINRCLQKVASSRYGICSICEEVINIERLKVNIFSEHCISCRETIEEKYTPAIRF